MIVWVRGWCASCQSARHGTCEKCACAKEGKGCVDCLLSRDGFFYVRIHLALDLEESKTPFKLNVRMMVALRVDMQLP